MPTYEYRCPKCGTEFDAFQKMSAKPVAKCPKCGSKAERLMSAGAGLVFKGSGFYLTDYGRSGQKPRAESEASSSSDKPAAADKPSGDKSGGDKSGGDKPPPTSAPKSKPRKKAD